MRNLRKGLTVNELGHLTMGGIDCVSIAQRYGTPLYVMDLDYVRDICKGYAETMRSQYPNGKILYASKAFCNTAMYRLVSQWGLGVDVVSGGELYTAKQADVDMQYVCFHGNNKTLSEMQAALEAGVGYFVIDSDTEADVLNALCKEKGIRQSCLVRINPGVEAHTHHYIQTAKVDSKFGFSIGNQEAFRIVAHLLRCEHLQLEGFHCHIGSQIFELNAFKKAVDVMTTFMADCKAQFGYETKVLNMGGGFGIWYAEGDEPLLPVEYVECVINALKQELQQKQLAFPYLMLEPGRSIVGEAGITLYTVGSVKEIPEIRNYLNIDGGMFENPRFALYQAKYTALIANKMKEPADCVYTVAGKCCESGDMIAVDVNLPKAERGDIVAVLSTGAYNYSMASNYNRNPVPGVLAIQEGKCGFMVRPQTYADLVRNDCELHLEDFD